MPTSVNAITPLIGQILLETETHHRDGENVQLYLFHNRPNSGATYEPVCQHLLPLDEKWKTQAGPSRLADRKLARGGWLPRGDVVGTRQGVSFCFALQSFRRILGERKREPTGRHATSRTKHRRNVEHPQSDVSAFAPNIN